MDVPSFVLEKLLCTKCGSYLSRGPVLITDNGSNVCGRCGLLEDNGRNVPYEVLAKLMRFPCSYDKYGCRHKVMFDETEKHEAICEYRKFTCPLVGNCDWIGVNSELLEHCELKHPELLVQNPVELRHNITKYSCENYLLSALQVLFLIQVKVCLVTRTIYHSVRLIGQSKRAAKYSFDLNIDNETGGLYKHSLVAPQGCLDLESGSSIMTSINILLGFLGPYKGVKFTVKVRTTNDATLDEIEADMRRLSLQVECVMCQYKTQPIWRDSKGWHCTHCAPGRLPCKYQAEGCKYIDVKAKNNKHYYYCPYNTYCKLCQMHINEQNLDTHYSQCHLDITQNPGTVWSSTVSNVPKWRIITTDFGKALCHYWVYGSKFFMYVRIPIPSDQLHMYECVVEISHPVTGRAVTWSADVQYFYVWDWELTTPDANVYQYVSCKKINVKVDFIKTIDKNVTQH